MAGRCWSSRYAESNKILVSLADFKAVSTETLFGGKSSDIFSLTGQLVRKNAQSLKGLPAGIYVVDGKKVVVR